MLAHGRAGLQPVGAAMLTSSDSAGICDRIKSRASLYYLCRSLDDMDNSNQYRWQLKLRVLVPAVVR